MIKKTLLILILSTSLLPLKAQDFLVVTGKSVTINGNTSFGRFACDYLDDEGDTLVFEAGYVRENPVMDIVLPVHEFGCGNKMLDRDFNKTLQSEEYPYIRVKVEQFLLEDGEYFSSLSLKLVGKELLMEKLPFILEESKDGETILKAEFELNLKYFDLTPPKKFLGLLKVHEELHIKLSLALSE